MVKDAVDTLQKDIDALRQENKQLKEALAKAGGESGFCFWLPEAFLWFV